MAACAYARAPPGGRPACLQPASKRDRGRARGVGSGAAAAPVRTGLSVSRTRGGGDQPRDRLPESDGRGCAAGAGARAISSCRSFHIRDRSVEDVWIPPASGPPDAPLAALLRELLVAA